MCRIEFGNNYYFQLILIKNTNNLNINSLLMSVSKEFLDDIPKNKKLVVELGMGDGNLINSLSEKIRIIILLA